MEVIDPQGLEKARWIDGDKEEMEQVCSRAPLMGALYPRV